MANIIRPSFSFKNLPIYRVKSVGKKTKNVSVPHSLDFTRQVSTVEEAPLDGGKYVRTNKEWQNIADALLAIGTLPEYLKKNEEDKGSTAVGTHEEDYNHDTFLTSGDFSEEFKLGSSGKIEVDEVSVDKVSGLAIPEDVSELSDTQGIIPPILHFDPLTIGGEGTSALPYTVIGGGGNGGGTPIVFDPTEFAGVGTALDPISVGTIDALKIANLPSGGRISKFIEIELANRATGIIISNWGNEAFDIKSGTIVFSGELMFENEAGDETPGTPNLRVFVNGTINANRVVFYDLVFNSNTPTPYFGDVYGAQYLRYYNPHRFQITITFSKKLYVTMTAYGGSQDDNDKRTYKVLESTSEYNSNDSIKQISIGIVAPIYASAGSKIRVAQIN